VFGALLRKFGWDRTGSLEPGVTTMDATRQLMGAPDMEWHEKREVIWEYAFTPEGTRNYMLAFDANRMLSRVEQVLTPENFAQVQPGMSRDTIRRLLGRPATRVVFERRGEEVWDWKMPASSDVVAHFNVHFDLAGSVTGTSRTERSLGA
jgi:hypothetical protein